MNPNPNAPGSIPQRYRHIPAVLAGLMGWGLALMAALVLGFTAALAIAAVIF